jgi:DNA polymerase III gamma/tau subunit
MSLSVKYRPKLLKEIVGNDNTIKSMRVLFERGDMPHTLLFTGPSGSGKTTLARIVAKFLKCSDWDFKEMNTADFRGIDSAREIVQQMNLNPLNGPCRVWLLDEAHQLTKDAQHALLKALEDCPAHVYFLLATTEPEKLLSTIKTRCVTFALRALNDKEMGLVIQHAVEGEKQSVPKEVIDQIVLDSNGSARMALSILDKVIGMDEVEMLESAKQTAAETNEAINLCRALIGKRPWKEVSTILQGLTQDPESVRRAVLGYASAVLLKSGQGQSFVVLDSFSKDFFTTGKAGLTMACYMAVNG